MFKTPLTVRSHPWPEDGPRGTVGPPYGPKDRGPLVLRAGGGTSGRPPTVRWARTRARRSKTGCGIVCSRRGEA